MVARSQLPPGQSESVVQLRELLDPPTHTRLVLPRICVRNAGTPATSTNNSYSASVGSLQAADGGETPVSAGETSTVQMPSEPTVKTVAGQLNAGGGKVHRKSSSAKKKSKVPQTPRSSKSAAVAPLTVSTLIITSSPAPTEKIQASDRVGLQGAMVPDCGDTPTPRPPVITSLSQPAANIVTATNADKAAPAAPNRVENSIM